MKRTELKRKTPLKAKSPMKKSSKPKMTKIRASAKGEQCQVRVPGICNRDPSTTVLAHLNGSGTALKTSDHEAAYACSACHAWLDGGFATTGYNRDIRDLWHLQAVIRTQRILIEQGLIEIKGAA